MRIDAHQHFWQFNQQDYGWMGPEMKILQVNHLPQDLRPEIDSVGIAGTIAVQSRQSLKETSWLLTLAQEFSFIKGVVGWVDLRSPKVGEQLERFSKHPKLCGIRHVVHDEPDDNFILGDDFQRGISLLMAYDLTYDLLIFPKHLKAAHELVTNFPEQKFILDHIAKPNIKDGILTPWDQDIRKLGSFPNVSCKLSGMVTEADWRKWEPEDFRSYLDVVFDAFGPERLAFGSDWPVCRVAGTYQEIFKLVNDYIDPLAPRERSLILGENAAEFYGIG